MRLKADVEEYFFYKTMRETYMELGHVCCMPTELQAKVIQWSPGQQAGVTAGLKREGDKFSIFLINLGSNWHKIVKIG